MIAQSHRALKYLHPDNLTHRTATTWRLGYAYELQSDRASARKAYSEAISISQASGNTYINILATIGLGNIQLAENQLHLAAETYQRVLQLVRDLPIPVAWLAHLCLGRIFYEWNDLDAAQKHGRQSLQKARQHINHIELIGACHAFLAQLRLAQEDVAGATAILEEVDQSAPPYDYPHHVAEIATVNVMTLLHQGDLAAAAELAEEHELPISQARVHLAQGDPSAALAVLGPWRQQVEAKGLADERLKVMVLQAVALHTLGEKEQALQLLGDALALAEPEGFIRIFVDEGLPMARLIREALGRGIAPDYGRRLLAAFPGEQPVQADTLTSLADQSELVEPLSERELEVLQRIAEGLTNREIADRLYLSLNTVKVHTRNIYGKLGVNNRMQAVATARELGVLNTP
jgi:LuxR family maltose regulon positive regulatory protein